MQKGRLKKLRVILSLLFFAVIALLFFELFGKVFNVSPLLILRFQFVPSLVQFIATLSFLSLGFAVIVLLTLLFGRIYCSTLCPLGTLQDLFAYLSKKLSPKRKIFKYKKPVNWMRYGILALVFLSLFTGSILLVNLLDPYSAFGKIASNFIRPMLVA
ncbi:MAG: 4Fe-4S binding protein, partial [Bacteroidales bacterium]|nr:4Fe-4S binding protein [Bacteroidales bacterium]